MTTPPLLVASSLEKVFGSGRTAVRAVDGVDLEVAAGDVSLVMGPSGSGKTTLLTMLGGLLHPTAGRIEIEGVDITSLDRRQLARFRRQTVGFVFQTFNLLETLTARENVEIALNVAGVSGDLARERATELLVSADLEDRLDFRARDLSGGEKQRVSIARALANSPRLLLADEPTANLDSEQGRAVMQLLRRLAKDRDCGVVAVSHDTRLQAIADHVLVLEDGRLVSGRETSAEKPQAPRAGHHWRLARRLRA